MATTPPNILRFTDPRQGRIAERLFMLVGPGAAAFFRDACRHMADPTRMEATTHQVGHLIRELHSSLKYVLHPLTGQEMVEDEKGDLKPGTSEVETVKAILTALGIGLDQGISKAWLRHAKRLHRWAHRRSLEAPRPVDARFAAYWDDTVGYLDVILERFEKSFLGVQRRIDRLVEKETPDAIDIKFIKETVPNTVSGRGYFFDRLHYHGWVRLLNDAGLFSDPPGAERNEAAKTVTYPPWPAGHYLVRIVGNADTQPLLADIAEAVSLGDNVFVGQILAEIATGLPVCLSKRLVPKACEWLRGSPQGWFEDDLAELLVALALAGETGEALALATAFFEVYPDPRAEEKRAGSITLSPEAVSRLDSWHYEHLLEKCVGPLAKMAGMRALDFFCGLLDRAIELSLREDRGNVDEDYSGIWRPAVEDHAQNSSHGVKDSLVGAVRDVAMAVVTEHPDKMAAVVEALESRRWLICKRIALYVLSEAGQAAPELVEKRLADKRIFSEGRMKHEYSLLARRQFGRLPDDTRETILSWVAEGPDEARLKKRAEKNGATLTAADIVTYRETWQRDRLALLGELPDEWKDRYAELVAKRGKPEHADFASYHTSWVGPTSPKTNEELAAMAVPELVAYLASWTPPSDWMSPSREGLGRQLEAVVSAAPGRFADSAEAFKAVDSTYVSALISGLQQALKAGRPFDWLPVLRLADWAVRQSDSVPRRDREDGDPDWGWTRQAIASLLEKALGSRPTTLTLEHRRFAWAILTVLVEDRDPTPENEEKYGGTNMDPATMSINTVRGQAMHSLIEYARWLSFLKAEGTAIEPRTFDGMPEVREVLERHLDPTVDLSTTVRAIYGWHLGTLVYLDRGWVESRLNRIFPADPGQSTLRDAAWHTHLATNSPTLAWPLLADLYRRAVDRLDTVASGDTPPFRHDPQEALAAHVMILHWHGMKGAEPLVERFFAMANDESREHAISFVGRSLHGAEEEVSREVIERLTTLWEGRLAEARRDPENHLQEMSAFAWWASAPQFDLAWRLVQVGAVLKTTGRLDPGHIVAEMLVGTVATFPKEAVDCLTGLLDERVDRWAVTTHSEETRTVLETALKSGDAAAETAARELINSLAARGHREYVDLLKRKP